MTDHKTEDATDTQGQPSPAMAELEAWNVEFQAAPEPLAELPAAELRELAEIVRQLETWLAAREEAE